MNAHERRLRRPTSTDQRTREARLAVAVVAGTVIALGGIAVAGATRDSGGGGSVAASPVGFAAPAVTTTTAPAASAPAEDAAAGLSSDGDLVEAVAEDCVIEATRLALQDTGRDVECLQQGLVNAGYTSVSVTGTYDSATYAAVEQLQTERDLFVDGVVGRETAMSVGVWPDEEEFVVRTPPPAPGTKDSWGFPLSSVSSIGDDIPPLPANSGSGKRVVYERRGQRVWAVDENEQVIRSWLVTGSKYGNEQPGTHEVYSRSEESSAWNFKARLPLMIRYQKTAIGAIGFHGIPIHVSDGTPYQTEAELGTRMSGGCQRQANPDAAFLWAFAPVGTKVVVI
jgi:peptidoglycan hydrolase-like protein with peptidoglycan-binding domain